MQISMPLIHQAPKGSCTNPECIEKSLTTHYTNCYWIKYPKLQAKYSLDLMRPQRSQRNLRGSAAQDVIPTTEPTLEKDSWQLKILAVKGPKQSCWLRDSTANVYVCNNLRLMTAYLTNPIRFGGSTSDGILLGCGTVKIRPIKEDSSKRLILNLWNIFHLLNSLSNFVSLGLFNNIGIYHNNKNQTLYNKVSWKLLAFA